MKTNRYLLGLALLVAGALPTFAQVSNDNEDGVNKVDAHFARDYVPGQVLVKFKDESAIRIQNNANGGFRAASISSVDELLKEYDVEEMEKLFPTAEEKPTSQLRSRRAPNGTIVKERNLDKVFLLKMGEEKPMLELIEKLKEMPEVEYAEPNYRVYITADVPTDYSSVPHRQRKDIKLSPVRTETDATIICSNPSNNPLYSQQYGITQQNIHTLWDKPIINKKRPVIAILDTGVDITHPDLKYNIWQNTKEVEGEKAFDDDGNGIVDDRYGWNFVDNYGDLTDRNGHGTHVAGIAAAVDNNIGIVGANPLALIMPIKVINDRGDGDVATICRGIVYAAENGADVINMSFGHVGSLSGTEIDAIKKAYQTAILVASAGNNYASIYDPCGGPLWPAAYYLVLGVQAADKNGNRVIWSNYDPDGPIYSEDGIDGRNHEMLLAGVDIYSTLPGGKYNKLSGTSMSAPLLAGAISALQMVKDYPSKDVLWGDLIHLEADFAKLYSDDTPRTPKLEVVALNIDDDVNSNTNIDGEVDAGETIKFYPVLRNTWANASNINIKLTVDNTYSSFVQVLVPQVPFGYSISAYGQETAQTPIIAQFANNIGDNTRIKLQLTITCAQSNEAITKDVYVTVNNMVKINGLISEDRTLTADHVYLVNDNIGIMEGVTLTIEPGTRLEFEDGMGLSSFGKLVANGTPEKPIVFTGHNGAVWAGIKSHNSTGQHSHADDLYTNEEQTLFTLLPTEATPNKITYKWKIIYYGANDDNPAKYFKLSDYIENFSEDFTTRQHLLTDPNYLTPAVLQMLSDWEAYWSQYPTQYSADNQNSAYIYAYFFNWSTYDNPRDAISYCRIEGYNADVGICHPYMKDCYILPCDGSACNLFYNLLGERNTITGAARIVYSGQINTSLTNSNIVNNNFTFPHANYAIYLPKYSRLINNNYFNNFAKCYESGTGKYDKKDYWLANNTSTPEIDKSTNPSYLGTSREDIVRPYIYEIGNAPNTYGQIDLSNMRTTPIAEAHGIVWKVCVNGKDAQDEYDDLAPLGVSKHKFEVYFNRPMNKAKIPQITFGVREPYTQHAVDEEGEGSGWNEEGTIYTAYKTITGRTMSDGVNRIYVQGAEDNEYFECPYEKTRFNINIQAAGSMATGFMAEAGLGKVELRWDNSHNDFDDAMGFNVYRYNYVEKDSLDCYGRTTGIKIIVPDTVRINQRIVDIETTQFTDYEVTSGITYYYLYRVLNTDLQEYDMSNVVAATPMSSTLGDANGSGDVDVADVITTVNYAAGQQPKPFIFEAADMNQDLAIDILDVVGIIQKILNPSAAPAMVMAEATATYTIEDGMLYVESPVALAGIQVQLNLPEKKDMTVADDLNGFEHASAWLSDNDYLFLAYNMNGKTLSAGKHALLRIGDAEISNIRLSDTMGGNVNVEGGEGTTSISAMGSKVMRQEGIYDLQGRKLSTLNSQLSTLKKGVYIINGEKVVK
jgi:subtilisin family serine protease